MDPLASLVMAGPWLASSSSRTPAECSCIESAFSAELFLVGVSLGGILRAGDHVSQPRGELLQKAGEAFLA